MVTGLFAVRAKRSVVCGCLAWLVLAAHGMAQAQASPEREVGLPELLAFAQQHAPPITRATQQQGYAAAVRQGADAWLPQNPTIDLAVGPRFSASQRALDFVASLSQPIEIAGERGRRQHAASQLGEQLQATTAETQWQVRARVIAAYWLTAVQRERAAVAGQGVAFAEAVRTIVQRRLAAGEATAIDALLADNDVLQAREAKLIEEQALFVARVSLAEVSGWPIETPPVVAATITTRTSIPPLVTLITGRQGQHPALLSRQAASREARARAELADREVWPDATLGVQMAREGSAGSPANYIVLGTLGLALPFWQSNQTERARARVDAAVADTEARAITRELSARLSTSHAALSSAIARLSLFASGVSSWEQRLTLLRRGFEAGELPLLTVVASRERFLQSQRDALDAYADYYRALVDLELALGMELPS